MFLAGAAVYLTGAGQRRCVRRPPADSAAGVSLACLAALWPRILMGFEGDLLWEEAFPSPEVTDAGLDQKVTAREGQSNEGHFNEQQFLHRTIERHALLLVL